MGEDSRGVSKKPLASLALPDNHLIVVASSRHCDCRRPPNQIDELHKFPGSGILVACSPH
jgi:hypothetical protein